MLRRKPFRDSNSRSRLVGMYGDTPQGLFSPAGSGRVGTKAALWLSLKPALRVTSLLTIMKKDAILASFSLVPPQGLEPWTP